ncbi:hypothetical protein B0A53_04109 [Rhodotorula sp. CCFEE 5036]|nr:hypothetical protein B0A53_04109 [Rhodotorula sp. CCFEE 5036]
MAGTAYLSTAPMQAQLYAKYRGQLKTNPKGLIEDLKQQRRLVTGQSAMRFSVRGSVNSLLHPVGAWVEHFPGRGPLKPKDLAKLTHVADKMTPCGKKPSGQGILYTIPSTQSTFMCAQARGVEYDHADCAALQVAAACLSATNSFLWNACRGPGLCYGASIDIDVHMVQMGLLIWNSPDVFAAWNAARQCIESLASCKTTIKETDLVAAKSNLIFGHADALSTAAAAAHAAFISQVIRGRPANYDRVAMQKLQSVTISDVLSAIRKYIVPLFAANTSIVGISTSPAKEADVYRNFTKQGYRLERRKSS